MRRLSLVTVSLALAASAAGLAACDAGFEGSRTDNAAPDTELAVRSTDLREDLGDRRLVSTVDVAWSGTDADGVVLAYEVRAYPIGDGLPDPSPEEGWNRTARRDSVILLPIPLGFETADVAVEVRAIDDEGAKDPTPARTVFPIRNSNPSFRFVEAEAPPDSTWPVVSFSFASADPDGDLNLLAVELALNDTTAGFTRIDPTTTFLTLVAEDPRAMGTTGARLYLGRGFSNSGITLPGLRLDADNVLYIRAVDQAGATSPTTRYPALDEDGQPLGAFYVRRVTSDILLVNDFRPSPPPPGQPLVRDLRPFEVAQEALAIHGAGSYDVWDLSFTPQSSVGAQFSEGLPATQDPTLRQTLAFWNRIYWVSNAVTNRVSGNNFPRAAPVLDLFFDQGGRILVHSPISLPQSEEEGSANPAVDVLPLEGLIEYPPGVRSLRSASGTAVRPVAQVPGTGRALPPLQTTRTIINALPYETRPDDIVLYEMGFYENASPSATWMGTEVVASMRADRRAALFALPLFTGTSAQFEPQGGTGEGVADALAVILDGLDFPTSAPLARR